MANAPEPRKPTSEISPAPPGSATLPAGLRPLALVLSVYALLGGFVSFLGWVIDRQGLTDWDRDGISIQPNAALAATIVSVGLILLFLRRRRAAALLGGVVALVGASALFEILSGVDLGIDSLFMFGHTWGQVGVLAPGRMGPPGSFCWTLLGTALILAASGPRTRASASWLACLTFGVSLLSMVGYLYGADELYSLPKLTLIAAQTSSFILALSIGLLIAIPERPPMSSLLEPDVAGTLTRRALPFVFLLPIGIGYLRVAGAHMGMFDLPFGTALRTLSEIVLLLGLLWFTALGVRRQARRAAEQERIARASDARLARILSGMTDAFIVFDSEWRFTFVNEQARERIGLGRQDLIGRTLWELFPDGVGNSAYASLQRAMNERVAVEYELYYEPWHRWSYDKVYPLDDGGLAIFSRDITERKNLEEERLQLLQSERRARGEAERASVMKDEFLATLSHELRTPLHAVLGWVRLLERRPFDPDLTKEALGVISRNAKAQADLISDLLDLSRVISGKLRLDVANVSLHDIVFEAVEAIRPAAEGKQIRLQTMLSPEAGPARGDAARLGQVMWNLLSNAVKFTPKGGSVQISLARVESYAEVIVIDTGIGIEPDFLPHVFDRFRQGDASTTREHGGLGLGLSIVKELVELHGGTVRAESAGPGLGAAFTITLPLALIRPSEAETWPDGAGRKPVLVHPIEEIDLAGVTVLAIDDQSDARDVIKAILERCRANVITAGSVDEGLVRLERDNPDIVLCDIGMPGKDGYSFIQEARVRNPQVPALAVTAIAHTESRIRALREGYNAHVAKPIEPAELVSIVAAFVKSRAAESRDVPTRK